MPYATIHPSVRFEGSELGSRARIFPKSERDRTTASLLTTVRLSACDCFRVDHSGSYRPASLSLRNSGENKLRQGATIT
jgi:hypothetical protein